MEKYKSKNNFDLPKNTKKTTIDDQGRVVYIPVSRTTK